MIFLILILIINLLSLSKIFTPAPARVKVGASVIWERGKWERH